ncbi:MULTISPECIES: DUF6750 family protein [unclassified Burkholderia]|uniref:DUF6750 family protein n=1 Tax=unclassified Burkholderia TaxID=2613784 RepID=UPI002AB1C999|nr:MULTISPECIES: DUF6750 family protein [unclassified Burkholderia]
MKSILRIAQASMSICMAVLGARPMSRLTTWVGDWLAEARLRVRGAGATISALIGLTLISTSAVADVPGWGTSVTNLTNLSDAGQTLVMAVASLIGVIALLYAGMLFWKKANRETSSEVKTSHILMAVAGGVFCLSIALVVRNSVQTVGGSSSDVGRRSVYNGNGY